MVLGFVPLVLLVAPLVGGAVAGYLERGGAKRGALAGGIAGVFMAALSAIVIAIIVAIRFGDLPVLSGGALLQSIGIVSLLSLAASFGQILSAAIGGGLGGLIEADRRRAFASASEEDRQAPGSMRGSWVIRILASLVLGFVTFAIVALGFTASLDPFIWPSALVGLPAGFVAGASVAVVGFHYLAHRNDPHPNTSGSYLGKIVAIRIVVIIDMSGLASGRDALSIQHDTIVGSPVGPD